MEMYSNPLLNSLIIDNVVRFLPYNDLKAFRLVCRLWNEEIRKSLRKLSQVRIDGDKQLTDMMTAPCDPKFCLDFSFGPGVNLNHSPEDNNPVVNQLLSKYGPNIKSLSLVKCICSLENLKAILYHGCPTLETLNFVAVVSGRLFASTYQIEKKDLLPHLKCLHLNVSSGGLVRNTEFMVDLLSICPNLEQMSWLKLAHDEVSYDRNFQLDLEKAWSAQRPASGLTIRDTIYDVAIHFKPLHLSRLNKIESNMRLNHASVVALKERQFPLRYLDIRLTINVDAVSLCSLLESISGTLKSLKIEFYPCLLDVGPLSLKHAKLNPRQFQFPALDKLEHLYIKTFYGSFNFLMGLKSLKSLSLSEFDIQECFTQMKKDVVGLCHPDKELNSSLQLFQVFPDDKRWTNEKDTAYATEDINTLAKAFPNLSAVRIKGALKRKKRWFTRFPRLQTLADTATEVGIGGLMGPKLDTNDECCYCCAHKLQRLTWSFR